jgi:hypothetical protein
MADNPTRIAASDVLDAIVEIVSDAMLSGDFDSFASVFNAPQQMTTMAGQIDMETLEDMRRGFMEMHRMFKENGITALRTEIGDCRFAGETRIMSRQMTEGVTEEGKALPAFAIFLTIDHIDGSWKVTQSELLVAPNSETARALAKADRTARTSTD